jgi:hypothetical protein
MQNRYTGDVGDFGKYGTVIKQKKTLSDSSLHAAAQLCYQQLRKCIRLFLY